MRQGYFELLRTERHFRRMWLGDVVSFLGDWFNTVAIYTSIQAMTGDARAVAGVLIAKTLPVFLVSPLTGPIVDRFDRRKLLIATDVGRALGVLGLIASHRAHSIAGLYLCTTIMIAFTGLALPAKNASLPLLVPADRLVTANALSGGTWSVMLTIGAAFGGVATEYLGVTASFAIDGASFVAAALLYAGLPALKPAKQSRSETSYVEGLRYLLRTPFILVLSLMRPMINLTTGAIVLLPLFGKAFGGGKSGALYTGILYSARGLGAVIGTMLVRLVTGDDPTTLRRMMIPGAFLAGAAFVAGSFHPTLVGVALACVLGAIGSGLIWVFAGTLLQLETDRAFHGRVFAVEFGLVTLAMAASSWTQSVLVESGLSLEGTFRAAGLVVVLPITVWTVTLLRRKPS